ncbi:hypothetical protein Hanom_Chr17g01578181 [Helianthus anomalus]
MHHVVTLIAERHGGTCTNQSLTPIESGVSLEAASLFLQVRGKVVYIIPSSDPTLTLLLVGFTEYDDDDDDIASRIRRCELRTRNGMYLGP